MASPPQPAAATNGDVTVDLDVSKLSNLPPEQQDLYLLTFTYDLQRHVEQLTPEALPHHQASIKKEVIKVVALSAPVPSRVIRNTLGAILADAFSRGSHALLYDLINELTAIVNTGKTDKEQGSKHAATVCLGALFRTCGASAVSLSGLVASSLLKMLKSSHVGFRGCALRALGDLVTGVGGSLDEHLARDIWKQARSAAANDKSAFVQACACSCLRSLLTETLHFHDSSDFDNLRTTMWKAIDSTCAPVRHAAAVTMATALRATYTETNAGDAPILRNPKKAKKSGANLDEEGPDKESAPASTAQTKSAVRLSHSLNEALRVLSAHYCKSSTTNRARAALALSYRTLLRLLPRKTVEESYASIAVHMYVDLINHPSIAFNRYRLLLTRNLVRWLLAGVTSLLTENAQINAARYLINEILKNYPQVMPERREPAKRVLVGALSTLNDLLARLGPASTGFQDSCREALFQVVQHPNYTVQSHAAQCFKNFILACPNQLAVSIEHGMSLLRKEIQPSTEVRVPHRKCLGYATSVAAMISSARHRPLYCSTDTFANIFSFATDLLKSSAAAELRISAMHVQVAWTLISGLMTLGPSFVKVHLNQLMLLWRNALPPPLSLENAARRSHLELSFLSHVRECALGALLMFVLSCSVLITTDGSRRISTMLHNTMLFLDTLPAVRDAEDLAQRVFPALQLRDVVILLRRRVIQCFTALAGLKSLEQVEVVSQADLVGLAVRTFMDPERPTQKRLELSLTNSASNFGGLWEIGDNWSFGASSIAGHVDTYLSFETELPSQSDVSSEQRPTFPDDVLVCPSLPALEHDPTMVLRQDHGIHDADLSSPATTCVNLAIKLFALSLPVQPARIQESTIEQLVTAVSQSLPREPGKKAAMQVNSALALQCALAVADKETPFQAGKLHVDTIAPVVADLLEKLVCNSDAILRHAAAHAIGHLCNLSGSQFTNKQIKRLIDTIVTNRDPNARAGCALALGHIHFEVGAMAASLHIKSIVGVLLSLCNDNHTTVHFWALKALVLVAESAGPAFSTYATSTLGLLAQLYSSDVHNEESAFVSASDLELDLPTPLALAQAVDSIIHVLGPDLQDLSKTRNLILVLIGYMQKEASVPLRSATYQCLRHLSMYTPSHVHFAQYVLDLQANLSSDEELLRAASVRGLGELVKRNAAEVGRVATAKLNDDLWTWLDIAPKDRDVQMILRNWMQQTILVETAAWVDKCQNILSQTRTRSQPAPRSAVVTTKPTVPDLADEEVAGFAAAAGPEAPDAAPEGQELLRWQTRDFAMQLLSESIGIIQAATSSDRVTPAEEALQNKIAEVVRVGFFASTANVVELRIWGLKIIDQILKMFGKTPDPDFLEASLLEQYQAQISSALTPAFAADSSPELAAEAIGVCATFVATGIVTNVDRMGRIFRVLAMGLDNLVQPTPETAIGDLKGLSPNAQAMLKMAILSGWAQLQLATSDQSYLDEILQPYLPKLAPLWLTSLQEFAALRFEPEISDTLGGEVAGGERYASFNREVCLTFYQNSWLSIVDAIALLVEKDSDAVFDALDNKHVSPASGPSSKAPERGRDRSFREEPVAFFFILFGLAFEDLVIRARDDPPRALAILQVLRRLLTPEVCGSSIYDDVVFNETTGMFNRLALVGTRETQTVLVEIARNLSLDHLTSKSDDREEQLTDDIDQLFELSRIVLLVLTGLVRTLEDPPGPAVRRLEDDEVSLIHLSFQALVDVASVYPSIIRADLYACIFHTYSTLLATGICQDQVLPRIIPLFKSFLQEVIRSADPDVALRLIRGSLQRLLATLAIAQRRENEYAITCAKNTLLSMTVMLTNASSLIPPNEPLVGQILTELVDCLQDVGLAKIAAGCVRSLLVTNPKSACEETVSRTLWTQLVPFVCDAHAEDPEKVKPTLVQALVASVGTLPRSGQSAAMAILVPALLVRTMQTPPGGLPEGAREENAARLLELARVDQLAFKAVVALLDDDQRAELESLVRAAGVARREAASSGEEAEMKPAIELRMDFD